MYYALFAILAVIALFSIFYFIGKEKKQQLKILNNHGKQKTLDKSNFSIRFD
jgi:type II secretory pathway pseudopilin PulG